MKLCIVNFNRELKTTCAENVYLFKFQPLAEDPVHTTRLSYFLLKLICGPSLPCDLFLLGINLVHLAMIFFSMYFPFKCKLITKNPRRKKVCHVSLAISTGKLIEVMHRIKLVFMW